MSVHDRSEWKAVVNSQEMTALRTHGGGYHASDIILGSDQVQDGGES